LFLLCYRMVSVVCIVFGLGFGGVVRIGV